MNRVAFNLQRDLRKALLARGFAGGHQDYRRFILLGEGRTGSNFLRGLLNSHPSIVTYGELFRFPDAIGWEFPDHDAHLQTPRLIESSQRDPVRFLEEEVFAPYPSEVAAVGFKIFYYHAQDGTRSAIWTHLEQDRDLAVLHIKRWNKLRTLLSLRKAFETNRWTETSGPSPDDLSVRLDFEECRERFEHSSALGEEFDRRFREHPVLEIVYETLCESLESECARIQQFLRVPSRPLRPSTYKQSSLPLSKAIVNYEELREKFRATRWEAFFDE